MKLYQIHILPHLVKHAVLFENNNNGSNQFCIHFYDVWYNLIILFAWIEYLLISSIYFSTYSPTVQFLHCQCCWIPVCSLDFCLFSITHANCHALVYTIFIQIEAGLESKPNSNRSLHKGGFNSPTSNLIWSNSLNSSYLSPSWQFTLWNFVLGRLIFKLTLIEGI